MAGVDSLTRHPSAESWNPGAAGLVLHTIVADPANADKLWVGISAAGVFATEDGGATWERRNRLSNAEACSGHDHPAGPRDREAMESVLKQLKKKYQLVVVDTLPVLLASSATFLAKFADLAVVVVRWGQTDTETLSRALKKLQLMAAVPLGIAINRVDFNRQAKLRYDSAAKYQAYADNYYYRN